MQASRTDFSVDQAMNPFRTGKLVLFQVTYNRDWHFFEIMFFVVLGIFGVLSCVTCSSPIELIKYSRDYMVHS
jgi:H+/Cl- antiporter ClcA